MEYDETLEHIIDHGDFDNISSYVRVDIAGGVSAGSITPNLIPAGFEAVYEPIAGFSGYSLPSASLVYSNTVQILFQGLITLTVTL